MVEPYPKFDCTIYEVIGLPPLLGAVQLKVIAVEADPERTTGAGWLGTVAAIT
jgi:hypothetical protein